MLHCYTTVLCPTIHTCSQWRLQRLSVITQFYVIACSVALHTYCCVNLFSPLWTLTDIAEHFWSSLRSLLYRQRINNDEFQLQTYFLLLKNEQHFAPRNLVSEFLSNSSLLKPNAYKTHWIHSNIFLWTDVTILSTYAKFHSVSVTRICVTRICEKNELKIRFYFTHIKATSKRIK